MRIWEKDKHLLVGERSSNESLRMMKKQTKKKELWNNFLTTSSLKYLKVHHMIKTVSCDGQFSIMDTVIQSVKMF